MILPSQLEEGKMETYIVLSYPLKSDETVHGAIFIYQNPSALHKTSQETTKIVFLSAFIAFVLTTFLHFPFFSNNVATS